MVNMLAFGRWCDGWMKRASRCDAVLAVKGCDAHRGEASFNED